MNNTIETIHQYGRIYSDEPSRVRIASRGFLVDGNKILLSHELNTGVYLIPGGGNENGETNEECCVRELREETGYDVETGDEFLVINEHFREILYVSHYFVCKIKGKGVQTLTESEIEHGVVPEWVEIERALEIFGRHAEYAEIDEEIQGQYFREYTAIQRYIQKFCASKTL